VVVTRERARRGARSRTTSQGAAAVEFALVSLVLIPLVLGMVQYGLLFNDSLQTRQATRLAARQGVVWASSISTAPCNSGTGAAQLACRVKSLTNPVTGKRAVLVKTTQAWARGATLYVCSVVQSAAASAGVVPVPNGGAVRSVTAMAIEKDSTSAAGFTNPTGFTGPTTEYSSDFASPSTDPSGGGWSWCA